ncbi:fibro-slime domain-containing protein [Myxococcota bacterium]
MVWCPGFWWRGRPWWRLCVLGAGLAALGCSASAESDGRAPRLASARQQSPKNDGVSLRSSQTSTPVLEVSAGDLPEECDNILPVVYRDFAHTHPDFEMDYRGDVVRRQLVAPDLGADRKPVFLSQTGCPWDEASPIACANWNTSTPVLSTVDAFNQWYRDAPDVNHRIEKELVLEDQGTGQYVYSSDAFFPLDPTEGWGLTPPDHPMGQNFLFTTEIHLRFRYVRGQKFSFFGDDDLWIFVNGRLALDLGSTHSKALGTIDFDAQAVDLGISAGSSYSMDIFHAERHTDGSNFRIETNISCFEPVVVR